MRTIVWFRGKDLRVTDHAPLRDAVARGGDLIPLFVLDPYFFAPARARELPHRMQFLLESIRALDAKLKWLGTWLVLVEGKSVNVVPALAKKWKADRVVACRWTEPFGRERDRRIQQALGDRFVLFPGETLGEPGTLRTASGGTPYSVFTQFAKAFEKSVKVAEPFGKPRSLLPVPKDVLSTGKLPTLESLGLSHNPNLQKGGEEEARKRLKAFGGGVAAKYARDRDRMDLPGTSRLSADLKFGTLSIRELWHEAAGAPVYRNELLWRELAYSTLWDRPEVLEAPFKPAWKRFPWEDDEQRWDAWATGRTGYPVVDASARQLLGEGFVHNRARMISASFLTKHLLISYRRGEAHYMKYLTDGDWANNNLGWQWSTGCGCDAQPYFRVFNPVSQGERYDPLGDYVKRWVPELRDVAPEWIHRPWEAPLGERPKDYPPPIVDHAEARAKFLRLAKTSLKG